MGSQIRFFADDVDIADLLEYAEKSGFVAIPDIIESDSLPAPVPPTQFASAQPTSTQCFHLLPGNVSAAEAFYGDLQDSPGRSRIMKRVSPVTEVMPSVIEDGKIKDGRIQFTMDNHVSHFVAGRKGYERLARYVRKWARTKEYSFRVGPHTAAEVKNGRLTLVHWSEILTICE